VGVGVLIKKKKKKPFLTDDDTCTALIGLGFPL